MRPLKHIVFLLLLGSAATEARSQGADTARVVSPQGLADMLLEYMQARYPAAPSEGCLLYVAVRRQRMYYVVDGVMRNAYVISTSRNGLGGGQDSECTPEGLHRVSEKIGAAVPPFGILQGRQFTGAIAGPDGTDDDLITSRILWLDGMEPGVNKGGGVDSRGRGIYIHGTDDEASLGRPSSHGCIRMRHADIIALFDQVPIGTLVVVLDN